ncbi:MAG: hypothetical protein HOQ07_07095 [Sinomonas sp.]|nr:hypothetical protein [Sinomonas sp.]
MDSNDAVRAWNHAGNPTPLERLSRYAQALSVGHRIDVYRTLTDAQEDHAILALYRVDRPQATIADLHQVAPLGLSSYHQMLHDLAREGLGPVEIGPYR